MTISPPDQLEELYTRIHTESCSSIINEGVHPDRYLRHPATDRRFGLTLLVEIDRILSESMCSIGEEIKMIEPEQYYYPATDLHVTVLDLVGAHEGFRCDEREIGIFSSMVVDAVKEVEPFDILFKGLILSPTGVLVKGYYREGLPVLRELLRREAGNRRVDMRERYQSITAHASLMRYSSPVADREQLLRFMEKNRDRTIGLVTVRSCTLVIHDWYNRRKEVVGRFALRGGALNAGFFR